MPALIVTKQYSDPVNPTSAQLDAALDSITTFFNVTGVGGDNIADGSLSTSTLADNAVTETKIPSASITTAKFSDGAVTAQKLAEALRNALSPPGIIKPYSGVSPPAGYLMCDGAQVSRTAYPNLFAAIGVNFGAGDSISTFNLPDLRGRILRGVDGSAGRDPDSAIRTAMNIGGSVGNAVGSVQADSFQNHRHTLNFSMIAPRVIYNPGAVTSAMVLDTINPKSNTDYASTRNGADGTRTSAETRPQNASFYYIIKT